MAGKTCLSRDEYTVGWICALPLEMAAATVMLDEVHRTYPSNHIDHNEYVLGHIGEHNIVVACLPSGEYGIAPATTVAMQLLSSFHSIRFGLMVGIGGGVPKEDKDIRLGDIVVSMLNRPPPSLLTALSKLKATHYTKPSQVMNFLAEIEQKLPTEQAANFARPTQTDHLFLDNYDHTNNHTQPCNGCDTTQTVPRPVVKDSQLRDKLGRELGVLCVEMEAAGLMNNYPCLVIRGICDYADSHKNKEWQGHAAAVAAAYAKELLLTVSADQTRNTRVITNVPSSPTVSGHCLIIIYVDLI
ncbi:Pfs domain protein [Aspergillus novofumigatus IBT 16806]|uniref:Pfs domain protein n=1 Tax=Aspergillus novofumigatus (strain IBT 16806) TaxID=1392255 RepID=A0A2I1BYZ5_ASPN1|nr:Pfs domain protein [Aspergillus novofumigatus IBT 16806]PKX90602.1 Pfs domain protein [Aspergillus novofumigatus IBT 16806]